MSYELKIYCRIGSAATRAALADLITHGSYFDIAPTYAPPSDAPDLPAVEWESFDIHYDAARSPLTVTRNAAADRVRADVETVAQTLAGAADDAAANALAQVRAAEVIYAITIDPFAVVDRVWRVLDAVGSFLAHTGQGIIHAVDEGFYDADLNVLVQL